MALLKLVFMGFAIAGAVGYHDRNIMALLKPCISAFSVNILNGYHDRNIMALLKPRKYYPNSHTINCVTMIEILWLY